MESALEPRTISRSFLAKQCRERALTSLSSAHIGLAKTCEKQKKEKTIWIQYKDLKKEKDAREKRSGKRKRALICSEKTYNYYTGT